MKMNLFIHPPGSTPVKIIIVWRVFIYVHTVLMSLKCFMLLLQNEEIEKEFPQKYRGHIQ